jgi:RHS repeat-associated protein
VVKAVTHIGFTGQEMLDNIDLVHMNGRVYDPLTGRFISADPFVQESLNSQSLNRYSYVANNPLSLIDPSGFSFISKIGKKIGRALKSVVKAFTKTVLPIAVKIVVTAVCLYFTAGADGGGAGCGALGNAAGALVGGAGGGNRTRGPPSGNIFEAPPGPSLPPGTIVFVGAPSQGVEIEQGQSDDTLGQVLLEVGIDLLKNGIIPIDAIQTLFNPNSTWKERALATLEIGVALSPAKAAQLAKALYKAGKRVKAATSRLKRADFCEFCFAAGTLVATANGDEPIETLEVGDEVIAVNESTGEVQHKKILKVFVNPRRPIWELTIVGEDGSIDVHRVTDDHPYWVKGMGWLPVAQLHTGMQLTSGNGQTLQLSDVRFTGTVETTYNLEVADWHTFLVGQQRVLAHNCYEVDNAVDFTKRLPQALRNKLKRIKNQTAAGGLKGIIGAVSEADSLRLAAEFLGPGARSISSGIGLISADGRRVFRFASKKTGVNGVTGERYSRTGRQVNFETRDANGVITSNVHLDVL